MSENKPRYIESLILKELYRRKELIAGAGAVGLGMLAYSFLAEPHWLEVTRHTVSVANLPPEWEGFRVAWLSDLHIDKRKPLPKAVQQAFEEVVSLKPDLAVLGGDMFDRGSWSRKAGELFAMLPAAGVKTLAIMGNHDYFSNRGAPARIAKELAAINIQMLVNDAVCIERGGVAQWVVGIDDLSKGLPNFAEATRKLPPNTKPLVFLAHNPKLAKRLPRDYCPLVLSGHTHGGQINPALPPFERKLNWIKWAETEIHSPYPMGWYSVKGNGLYVGRGLGTTRWPVRFNARPELPIFEFRRQPV